MAERIKNIPSPDILMNSLRSIGYSFKTALADIIDNSISVNAKNIWIDFPSYNSDNLYITILDDAVGMDDAALFNAIIAEGIPQKLEHNDIRWITPREIPEYDFCPADEEILKKIIEVFHG